MKVKDIIDKLNLKIVAGSNGLSKDINGVYCCDLLSWAMSHGKKNNVWITVQIHQNIVAVASLLEFSCIIIPENIEVESVTLDKANQEGIPVLLSQYSAYDICCKLKDAGI